MKNKLDARYGQTFLSLTTAASIVVTKDKEVRRKEGKKIELGTVVKGKVGELEVTVRFGALGRLRKEVSGLVWKVIGKK